MAGAYLVADAHACRRPPRHPWCWPPSCARMGGYGILRFNLPLFRRARKTGRGIIIALSVIAISLRRAVSARGTPDMKKLIAYSSGAHMGVVTLGIFTNILLTTRGDLNGFQWLDDGHAGPRTQHRGALLPRSVCFTNARKPACWRRCGCLTSRMPFLRVLFGMFTFASLGLPTLSGFVGEYLSVLSAWQVNKTARVDRLPGWSSWPPGNALVLPASGARTRPITSFPIRWTAS